MSERFRLALLREPAPPPFGTQITAPAQLAELVHALLRTEAQEVVLLLHLDRSHRLRGIQELARGGITSAEVDPKVLFASVLLAGAPAFALAHNHPSGDAAPSPDDIALSRRVGKGAEVFGLEFVDHLVLGEGWTSLRDLGVRF